VLPYFEQPALDLGFYRLTAFQVLLMAAIGTEYWIVTHRAPRLGISSATAAFLVFWGIVLGLLSAVAFHVLTYSPDLLRRSPDPEGLLRFWGISSVGGILGGLGGLLVLARRRGLSPGQIARFFDCVLFAMPFTLAIGRLGCALQHCHPGLRSTHWLAVRFPEGPRFDLGLLEFLFTAVVAVLFLLLDRKPRAAGFYGGLFFALYGPARFAMEMLRTGDARYLGWTPAQYVSLVTALGGLGVLMALFARRSDRGAGRSELRA
jgi:phosphatidylglycerol:prolipoprotein diacylglycerol transferase